MNSIPRFRSGRPLRALAAIGLASLAFASTPAAAGSYPKTSGKGPELILYRDSVVNGVTLPAGAYRIKVAPTLDSATVLRGAEPLVTAPCLVTVSQSPLPGTSVVYAGTGEGAGTVNRIVIASSHLSIDFEQGALIAAKRTREAEASTVQAKAPTRQE